MGAYSGQSGRSTGRAGNGRTQVRASWSDNESSWAVLPENVPEDPADEPDVLY